MTIPRPTHAPGATRLAPPIIAGALAVALALGVAAGALGLPALALLAPLYVAVCVVWPAAGVAALLVACALDRIAVSAGGPRLRPDELAALALAAALAVRLVLARPRPRPRPRPHIPLLLPVLVYYGTNLLSTVTSADPARSLSLDLLTLDLLLLYGALAASVATPARLVAAVRLWLGVATVEAIVGLIAFALYLRAHTAVPGVQLSPDTGAPQVYGTLYEGNIFGSYTSAAFLIALALVAAAPGARSGRRRLSLYLALVATGVGLLLSDTRSAWGATALCALLLLVLLRVGRRDARGHVVTRLLAGLLVAGVVVVVGLTLLPSGVTGALGTRLGGLLDFSSAGGSGHGRVLLYDVALGEWQAHPLLGTGPGSFTYRLPGDPGTGSAWIPNLAIQALHDTGVLGLLALLWLFAAFYATTLRALRRAPPGEPRAMLVGLIAAVTALLIASQLTPGFILGYSWALLALGTAAARAVSVVATPHGRGQAEVAAA